MILTWLILILLLGGVLAWVLSRWDPAWARWTALAALIIDLVLALGLWGLQPQQVEMLGASDWLVEFERDWIPQLGINLILAMDGLSLMLIILTLFLGIMAVGASWSEVQERVGFFHFNLMWVLAGIVGVFVALDLFLFYFFWELMLVPMYLLIVIWGHERRLYAAVKFFLFTQASGLLMLLAILGLYFVHGQQTGVYTFDYRQLLGAEVPAGLGFWLMLGFLIAFIVKLPSVPFHNWLPDAHAEAPTAGSVILAGLLLKTGGYGLLRFVLPLFPEEAASFAPVAMVLAVIGILYGAILAFAQTDLKRLIAYTSVSHMGFVLLGVFAWNEWALQGVVMQMVAHGISTGALFIIAGMIYERMHTRDMTRMGGLWSVMPRLSAVALLFAMASLGLPGMGNFIGEFLVLVGAFQASVGFTVVAALGLVAAAIYSLWLIQRTLHGENTEGWQAPDLTRRDAAITGVMIVVIVWLGLYPQPVLQTVQPTVQALVAEHRPATTALPMTAETDFLAWLDMRTGFGDIVGEARE